MPKITCYVKYLYALSTTSLSEHLAPFDRTRITCYVYILIPNLPQCLARHHLNGGTNLNLNRSIPTFQHS